MLPTCATAVVLPIWLNCCGKCSQHCTVLTALWSGVGPTLKLLDDRPWLDKRTHPALDKGLFRRTLWQRYNLSQSARDAGCDVLFVPDDSYAGNFHPVVTMSRNLLPFEICFGQAYFIHNV